jgi:hypothetical protein
MVTLELIQTAALVIVAGSSVFYTLNKRIVINKNDKPLLLALANEREKVKNHKKTIDNMNLYQEKYQEVYNKNIQLKQQVKDLDKDNTYLLDQLETKDKSLQNMLDRIEAIGVDNYKKGKV